MTTNLDRDTIENLVHDLANPLTVALMETYKMLMKLQKTPEENLNETVLKSLEKIQSKLTNMEEILLKMKQYQQTQDLTQDISIVENREKGIAQR